MWSFYCYDQRVIEEWLDLHKKSADFRGRHDTVFRMLKQQQKGTSVLIKSLGGGLHEILIKCSVQYRLIGIYWPEQGNSFTVLMVCWHKEKRYYPKQNAIEICRARKSEVIDGKTEILRCEPPGTH